MYDRKIETNNCLTFHVKEKTNHTICTFKRTLHKLKLIFKYMYLMNLFLQKKCNKDHLWLSGYGKLEAYVVIRLVPLASLQQYAFRLPCHHGWMVVKSSSTINLASRDIIYTEWNRIKSRNNEIIIFQKKYIDLRVGSLDPGSATYFCFTLMVMKATQQFLK